MAMNPRLLRPRASGYDPAAQVYFNAVAVADGEGLEPAVKKAINDFVVGCKRDGIWSAIKASCILMGARTLSGALTPLVGPAPTNNNFVSGDYNRKTGLVGNGSTKYLDTNRAANADPQNSFHQSVYITQASNNNQFCVAIGAGAFQTNGTSRLETNNQNMLAYNRAGQAFTILNGNTAGFTGHSRNASAAIAGRKDATNFSSSISSTAPLTSNSFVFTCNNSGVATQFGNFRLAFYSIGESLTLGMLSTRVTTLYNAIGAAIP